MFDIEYKGGNTVILTTKKATLVFDPKRSVNGLKDIAIAESVELATEDRLMNKNDEAKLQINCSGEFGVGDCDIKGVAVRRNIDGEDAPLGGVMYRVSIGDNNVAVLGNIYEKLSDEQLEELGLIDILIIPVGGGGLTLDAHSASKLVKKIDPKVIIPIHYADSKIKYEVNQENLEQFEKELGSAKDVTSRYKVKSAMTYPASLTLVELQIS